MRCVSVQQSQCIMAMIEVGKLSSGRRVHGAVSSRGGQYAVRNNSSRVVESSSFCARSQARARNVRQYASSAPPSSSPAGSIESNPFFLGEALHTSLTSYPSMYNSIVTVSGDKVDLINEFGGEQSRTVLAFIRHFG